MTLRIHPADCPTYAEWAQRGPHRSGPLNVRHKARLTGKPQFVLRADDSLMIVWHDHATNGMKTRILPPGMFQLEPILGYAVRTAT